MSAQFITQGAGAGLGIPITVSTSPYPNVPQLPGVPQLARSLLFPANSPPVIGTPSSQGALWQATQAAPIWGIFDSNNNLAVTADSVRGFGWRQEFKVSNYQIQRGSFASFNKILLPYESSVLVTKGGTLASRNLFLQQIDAIAASLSLYKIVTPEKTYLNCNVTRPELSRRGPEDATFFDVELFFVQIIEVDQQYGTIPGVPSLANSSVPSAIPPINSGQNNAQTPISAVQSAAAAAIVPPVPVG